MAGEIDKSDTGEASGRKVQLQRQRLAALFDELEQETETLEPRVMEEVRGSWPAPAEAEPRNA